MSARAELDLIRQIARNAGRQQSRGFVRLGIGDDCAILQPARGEELAVTTDFSLEGRHFRRETHPAEAIGHRTLARGLSDIAAMGARPRAAFLSLALPADVARNPRWLRGFLTGFHRLAAQHGVALAGGDTAEAPGDAILADVILIGGAPRGRALRRSTARPGDRLFCTGTLGGAAAELREVLAGQHRRTRRGAAIVHPHLFPSPRIAAGQALLRRRLATSAIDLSDGLSTDLAHLCESSAVGAEVDWCALPLAAALRPLPGPAQHELALHGGEDYELLFTAPATAHVPRRLAGVPVAEIGRIVPQPTRRSRRVLLIGADGQRRPLQPRGWEHFS